MTSDQVLALTGIIVTVVLAAAGFVVAKKVRRKSVTLNQTARDGSVGLQSVGNITTGNVTSGKRYD